MRSRLRVRYHRPRIGPDGAFSISGVSEAAPTLVASSAKKGIRFWLVLVALLLSTFLALLEGYAVSMALPTIVGDLHSNQFVWVASAYAIASTALLPLSGGLSEVFGRRPIVLGSVGLFALGGALAGASQSMNMLIAARVVQGAGAGGIFSMSQIILVCFLMLVTLQERGTYNGLFGLIWALGGGLGPVVGGALAHHTTWRWIFYLNVPGCGIALMFIVFALKLNRSDPGTIPSALARLDWIGNTLVIASTCACVIGLTWGGVVFGWRSAHVVVPIVLGIVGLVLFCVYEWHYLPVYYQACKDASPTRSGVNLFGLCFSTGPVSIIVGVSIAKLRRYRPQIWIGWCLIIRLQIHSIVGVALISTVTESTTKASSIGYQIIAGSGIGIIFSAAYFPVLAPLPITSNSPALALFMFFRTFAQAWGVTIGGTILQNELRSRLPEGLESHVPGLNNLAYAAIPIIRALPQPLKDQARHAFAESLATVWRLLIAVAGVGLIFSLPMKGLPLHTMKDENWAMRETEKKGAEIPELNGAL
ncbi:MFS general substrate transporter [Punctularia strigosozonata HHB-11173 SS5]|uniref:MFS general substrate transporter n=1 Tax=Punctularia strigosozonata (strain HHB-11173) TaxID=741275 RepID=UPI0004417141|nr:MFS general substrate transporter [Punctularia strigosozonata HHB-11173 SS5]EIN09718.1 MFS general substrate transporter [Punctularia strigosozonata HHB-11173 SS5]